MGNKYPFHELKSLSSQPKLVFMGSSTTASGYSLQAIREHYQLGRDEVISLALGPDNAEINYHILKDHIDGLRGSTVVYSIDPWIFSQYYYQNFNYKLSQWSLGQRWQLLFSRERPMGKVFDVISGGNARENITRSLIQSRKLNRDIFKDVDNLGRETDTRKVSGWFSYPEYGLSDDFIDSLRMLDELCHANACRLLVQFPIYSESFVRQYRQLEFHEEFTARIASALTYTKPDLKLKSLPDSMFADLVHIGVKGKEIQTAKLIDRLNEIGFGG